MTREEENKKAALIYRIENYLGINDPPHSANLCLLEEEVYMILNLLSPPTPIEGEQKTVSKEEIEKEANIYAAGFRKEEFIKADFIAGAEWMQSQLNNKDK